MRNNFTKYGLILLVAICFVNCNSAQKKEGKKTVEKKLFTEFKFIKWNYKKSEIETIAKEQFSHFLPKEDSIKNPMTRKWRKFNIQFLEIKNKTFDTVFVLGQIDSTDKFLYATAPYFYNDSTKMWCKDLKVQIGDWLGFHPIWPSLKKNYYNLYIETQDSMMFRYYFKTSQFKDSLMWHDVYYTFKNDSLLIVRQTENEK
ncbi:MAG: hypothetical protein RJA07_2808 [Bacteroidota bacterium]|jgi:hypothetical protein